MNRLGLAITLTVGVAVGFVFAFYPNLDITISGLFFDPAGHMFEADARPWAQDARAAARWLITLIVAPAFLAIAGKLLWPRRRMLIQDRAAVFLVVSLALGPGVTTGLLKDYWGRPRPIDIVEFGGHRPFVAWWDPRGTCRTNCSFVAGEPSGAFWTLAPAALAPPGLRAIAFAGAIAFGAAVGLLRISAGGHFFSDVVFAGVFTYLVIWLVYGALYRWPAIRPEPEAIGRALGQAGEALRRSCSALLRRLAGRTGKAR